jgi:hypothetical protein
MQLRHWEPPTTSILVVSNYLPMRLTNWQVSTPHELAHAVPPDYCKLIPIFAVGYTKVDSTTAAMHNDKLISQTVPTILIGNDDQSDGCLFYNPKTKNIIASSDYCLDHSLPSGQIVNLKHEQFHKQPSLPLSNTTYSWWQSLHHCNWDPSLNPCPTRYTS